MTLEDSDRADRRPLHHRRCQHAPKGSSLMTTPSWTSTMRRTAGHPVVRVAAAALLKALASHLTHQGADRPFCTEACNRPFAQADRP